MDKGFKVVYKNSLDSSELELIHKYWDFRENFEDFFYLPKQLINESLKKSIDVTKYVKSNSYILCENLKCIDCKENFSFHSRKDYIDFRKSDGTLCLKCFKNMIELKADEIIFELKNIIYKNKNISVKEINNLPYIEKVFLYYIILSLEGKNINEPVPKFDILKSLDVGIINDIYSDYINKLIENSIFHYIDSQKVTNYWSSVSKFWSEIQNRCTLTKIREIARLNGYGYKDTSLLFNNFEGVLDYSEYSEIILKSISNHILNEKDLKGIESFVFNHRLSQVKIIILQIKNDFKIPINMASLKLDFILLDMIGKTTLPKIYNMLFWAVGNLQKLLYTSEKNKVYFSRARIGNIYIKGLEYIFNKYRNNYEEAYDRKIPLDLIYDDDFIDFLSSNIIEENWNGSSCDDLIFKWQNNLNTV